MDQIKKSIVWMLVCTLFTSAAQAFYKFGVDNLTPTFLGVITNIPIILGLMLYGVGSLIMIKALKGADLSLLYPIIALSYIWVTILSALLFGEIINFYKIIGLILIICGVVAMGFGSRVAPTQEEVPQ